MPTDRTLSEWMTDEIDQSSLRDLWNSATSPVANVATEGVHVGNAQVRWLSGDVWLYVDDSDGFALVVASDVDRLNLIEDDESEDVADDEDEPHGLQEGDITTTDHIRWYCDGKLILTTADPDDAESQVKAWMDREGYYPDVWWISDHGNAHRISLEG